MTDADDLVTADVADLPKHAQVMYLKERVYAAFTGLAIVLVVRNGEHGAAYAFEVLLVGVVAITLAGFVSDVIAHLAVHQEFPHGHDLAIMVRAAAGALGSLLIPLGLIGAAWADVMALRTALLIAAFVYIGTLVVIGWLAVRNAQISWWKKLGALVTLALLGFVVLAIQVAAHSH
ncbi:hypothetical protein [Gordonia rhizosphera]|uniref:Uncharacterized protein n=1 Tax=Gordonia rhizosphera NBRC 16068 TaxID=1108045 RepID=K6WZL3_9ACTN|nr:hypothetical protein [Gordonia rhizosphera]GAB91999.1 hypothetical protein GORHZ_156_00100 [Gordonia rhizosphera NBRC 16068]